MITISGVLSGRPGLTINPTSGSVNLRPDQPPVLPGRQPRQRCPQGFRSWLEHLPLASIAA
jgi:hypothetical protein